MDKLKPLCFFVHFIIILLLLGIGSASTSQGTDQKSLIALKATISSDPYQILSTNWSNNASVCAWIGVTCNIHRRVTALNFSGFDYQGTLSPHLANLTFLTSLDLQSNNFTGTLPSWLGNLHRLQYISLYYNSFSGIIPPLFFGRNNNSKLRTLNLGYNFLTGNIPEEIGNLSALEALDLKYNRITGLIPPAVFNLSGIRTIDLTGNGLSGELPMDMCDNIPRISGLYLSENLFGGRIPFDIYKCGELVDLSLSFNHFSGSVPRSIGWLSNIERLFLGVNDFQGGIPTDLRNLTRLRVLSIRGASLTGQIPSFIFNMSFLETIDFYNNSLSGSLQDELRNCKMLSFVSLSDNKLTGHIPKHIGNLTELQHLYLANNKFTGELPGELGNLNLVNFNVHNNQLSGTIPSSLFNISTIQMLELSANHFSGHLPLTFGPSLRTLYLSDNKLSGTIPSSIANASSLTILAMGSNSFSGPMPNFGNLLLLQRLLVGENNLTGRSPNQELGFLSSLTRCRYLTEIEVSLNQLDGTLPASIGNFSNTFRVFRAFGCGIRGSIPGEIGNLTNLMDLYLDNNELTGLIPRTLGDLKELIRIYFEHNKLEGHIPSELCQLSRLGDFYVSHNNLNGTIPGCLGELRSLRGLYLDSNELESEVPLDLWKLNDLLLLNLSTNMLSGSLPSQIGNLRAIGTLDLSLNSFSGNIPSSIGKAGSLVFLSLARNEFQGSIPESLGDLSGLETLDLSYNNLSGSIPKSLEKLIDVSYFNVSYNGLEGEIPTEGSFRNFTALSFVKNHGLCGAARLGVPLCGETRSKISVVKLVKDVLPPFTVLAIIVAITVYWLTRRQKTSNEQPESETSLLKTWIGSSYLELLRATNDFSESNILGRGGFGSVYVGTLYNGLTVAIKVFDVLSEKVKRSFDTEIQALSAIRHRNLIKIIGCCSNSDFKALVLEYMPNGSLEKWLHSDNCFLDLVQRLNIAIDVASALEYLHLGLEFPIVHCDLKPSNVLLDKDMTAHVGDFGIAKLFSQGELMAQTRTLSTIGYMSPEYGAQGIVSTSGDVYSFGIMLLEMCTKKKPTDEMFGEETCLRSWVCLSLRKNTITEVVDPNLLGEDDINFPANEQCLSSVLNLAMDCLRLSHFERIGINEIVGRLQKIRGVFLATRELADTKVSYFVEMSS